jgi:4-diphosphocytidyl-2-C-methyl-D-erythritol kinase
MATYTKKSLAKLNLRLKVIGKRDDGYHLLDMWNVNLALHDLVKITVIDPEASSLKISISVDGPKSIGVPADLTNLAVKAASSFCQHFNIKSTINIDIQKHIPTGAGLGGGSSNAATVLLTLADIFKMDVEFKELATIGLKLGAELPYCLLGGFKCVSGIGEVLEEYNDRQQEIGKWLKGTPCLVFLGFPPLSTSKVFTAYNASSKAIYNRQPLPNNYQQLLDCIDNDLIEAASLLCPEVAEAIAELNNTFAGRASMTGSGSVLFALPEDPMDFSENEINAAQTVAKKFGLNLIQTELLG